jgi:ABC-type amino acid transport substrate-binding protein
VTANKNEVAYAILPAKTMTTTGFPNTIASLKGCGRYLLKRSVDGFCLPQTLIAQKKFFEQIYTINEINGKSEISGMNIEIINAFVRKAPEFQFKYKPGLPAPRLFYYLEKNIIQVVFGVAKNAEREKLYQYADIPLYPVKFSIIIRADDTDVRHISSLEDIRHSGGTVLGFSGSTAIKLFEKKTEHLGIPIEVAPSIEQNFNKLLKGRGRYFVFNHYSLIDGAKMLGYQNNIVPIQR